MPTAVFLLVLAGCGRLGFDALDTPDTPGTIDGSADSALDSLLRDCELRLQMDELDWTGPSQVFDSCGINQPGTAIGGAFPVTDPVRGQVGEFVGGTSCIEVDDNVALRGGGAFTIAAWIHPTTIAPGSFGIVSKRLDFGNDTAYSVFVWDNATAENRLYVDVNTEDERFELATDNFLDSWKHIAVVFDGTKPAANRVAIFVDGTFKTFVTETAATIVVPTAPPKISVGCLPLNGPAQSLVGRLDDVVFWSRALDDDEIGAWHAATVAP